MNVRDLQHLAAAMAHEVRNPLNSMAIHIELLEGKLKKGQPLSDKEKEGALKSTGVISSEIDRIDRILEEFLEHAGPEEAARSPVEATQLLARVVDGVRPEAQERGVGLEVKAGSALGTWAVDAEALGEAINAVLRNAVQASARGALVTVSARSVDDQAEIVVTDQGEGITKEDLARLFHIGWSKRGRDGLGLTVAKQIVKGHGGSILVQSGGPGQGATFTVRVPLEADPGDEDDFAADDDLDDA